MITTVPFSLSGFGFNQEFPSVTSLTWRQIVLPAVWLKTRDGKFSILRHLKPRFATKVCTGLGLVYLILTDTTTNFRPKPRYSIPQNTKFAIPNGIFLS